MKYFIGLMAFFCLQQLNGQTTSTSPKADSLKPLAPYLKTRKMPFFALRNTDSAIISISTLPKNKPTVIIYFNTDCDHCQDEATQIIANKSVFEKAQFVFVSTEPLYLIKAFKEKYSINGANFYIGRDQKYFVPRFFSVRFTPFVAVYDSKGLLTKVYEGGAKWQALEKLINSL